MKAKLFIDKMPETCDFCEFNDYSEGGMCILHYGVCPVGERADFCPLKPLSQVEAIPVEWLLNNIPIDSVMREYNRKLIEYLVIGWREENESNIGN